MVDGANRWQTFVILLCLLRPVILTTLFIRIMDTFRVFDEVWMLTSRPRKLLFVSIHLVREVYDHELWIQFGYVSFLLYLTIVICWLLLTFISISQEEV